VKLVPGAKPSRLIPLNIRDFWFDSRDDCYARISAATFAIKPREIVHSPDAKGRFTGQASKAARKAAPPVKRNLGQVQPVRDAARRYEARTARVNAAPKVNSTIGKYSDFRKDWGYGGAGVHVPTRFKYKGGSIRWK
jgi:hypothetical protein